MDSLEAVLSVARDGTIGVGGGLFWRDPRDMARFAELTRGHVVVMGRRTWESLPRKPLPSRINVVLTSWEVVGAEPKGEVHFVGMPRLAELLGRVRGHRRCFVIGGAATLQALLPHVRRIHLTHVDLAAGPAVADPTRLLGLPGFRIEAVNEPQTEPESEPQTEPESEPQTEPESEPQTEPAPSFCFLTLAREAGSWREGEEGYLSLLRAVLLRGNPRPDRTGTGTRSLFGEHLSFDLSGGRAPLLTTKRMAWRSCLAELLWFLRGSTDSKELEREGVGIWRGNSSREFLDARGLGDLQEGDIGAGYGFQWRHFGADYEGCGADYRGRGVDQIEAVVRSIREDPFGRRHVVSAWNPSALARTALPPCHVLFQFYVESSIPPRLSCHLYQRSVDCFLGLPFNIFSYAALTHLIAARTGTTAHRLVISMGDAHVYSNHREQVMEQVSRQPFHAPLLRLHPALATMPWEEMRAAGDHFRLVGYVHHPSIAAPMAV
jgi:thymidylate synthase